MKPTLLANRYARALVRVSLRKEGLEELKNFSVLLAQTPLLAVSLANPGIPFTNKKALVEKLVSAPVIQRLVLHLVSRNRLRMLPEIIRRSQELLDAEAGVARAVVRTASPLTAGQKQELAESLKGLVDRGVLIEEVPDSNLLAGMIIRIGDTIIDNSLQGQLKMLENQLAGRL